MMASTLTDSYGRQMRKLRVSLLDACNFRCSYCMPSDATFSKAHDLLSVEEIKDIVSKLNFFGIEELRLTGGEPTLRAELDGIAMALSELPLKKIGMTTNGYLLRDWLPLLKKTRLQSFNISLDSLKRERFFSISRRDALDDVIRSIDAAISQGFKVKINTVLMRENLDEIDDFLAFAKERDIEIRFLELMKVGVAIPHFEQQFVYASEVIHELRRRFKMKQMEVPKDSTSFKYLLQNGVQVGFIASESMSFCSSCSRLRLDSKGHLRSCLMAEDKTSLRGIPFEQYPALLKKVIALKPYQRLEQVNEEMYRIGG